ERNDFVNTTATDLIKRIRFNNDLYTYGSGFSLQLGAILKPIKEIRLGVSYQSPTWYKLNDELKQGISTVSGNNIGELPQDNVNPDITIIYPVYKLQTPGKLTGSFAYIFGKKGLLSFDYSLKNYGNSAFSPKNDEIFQSLNNSLTLHSREKASEYRVAGEYKIKQFSLRGGYHFEQSPYKNATTIGNLTGYSGGIGFNFGNKKLDLAYSTSKRDSNQQFFSQGFTDAAKINTTNNNVTLTFALEL
ncbi:OmpP1/FadL family transporter, partial [Flavobacterium sp.]|uniref:OmpP1/FadL family transporter n=1 Tax=Flavobacterium sp. TaxID=239 RepID=UPI00374DB425